MKKTFSDYLKQKRAYVRRICGCQPEFKRRKSSRTHEDWNQNLQGIED
jgi:hypothetical protein